jgi:hypothetical protein
MRETLLSFWGPEASFGLKLAELHWHSWFSDLELNRTSA